MKRLFSLAAALALAFCASLAGASVNGGWPASAPYEAPHAQTAGHSFTGRAIAVLDGDTIDVLLPDNSVERVRFAGIDAPEKDQSFGMEAKANLARKLHNKIVTVQFDERDKYGRAVGHVYFQGRYANLEQVADGCAWVYRQFASKLPYETFRDLDYAEANARGAGLGLWKSAYNIPPWDWRHRKG